MLILVGAYGRTYDTIEAAKVDWESGKDFKILAGPYCSIRDIKKMKEMNHDIVIRILHGRFPVDYIVHRSN